MQQTINNTFDIVKWAQKCLIHCIYEIKIRFNNTTQKPSNMSITYGDASESHTAIAKPRSVSNQYEKNRGESQVYSINKGGKQDEVMELSPIFDEGVGEDMVKQLCKKHMRIQSQEKEIMRTKLREVLR